MKRAGLLSMALIAGLSVLALDITGNGSCEEPSGREGGTMTKCLEEAHRHCPGKYYGWGEVRDYESNAACLTLAFPSKETPRGGAPVDGAVTIGWISKKRHAGGCRQCIPTKKGAAEGALWYFE